MKKVLCYLVFISIIMSVALLQEGSIHAEIRRDLIDAVVMGEWKPPQSDGGRAFFLPIEDFRPGKTLSARIRLEHAGEIVSIKFFIETPGQSRFMFKEDFQDNSSRDLDPKDNVLVAELTEIPSYPVTRYIVEANDDSGKTPIVSFLESPIEPSSFPEKLGNTFVKTAETIWDLPRRLLERERALGDSLRTLVIADTTGKIIHVMYSLQQGEIHSPIWLPDDRMLFIHTDEQTSLLKVVSSTLDGTPEDFGHSPIEGTEPHLIPDGTAVIFRQGTHIIHADLSGTTLTPLIQDKDVKHILGVFADAENDGYNLLFSAQKPEMPIDDIWMVRIQGTEVLSVEALPYSSHWFSLAQASLFGERMLYERQDIGDNGQQIWQIYLSQSPKKEGKRLLKDDYNNRYPAWSLDGTKIVFASDREK